MPMAAYASPAVFGAISLLLGAVVLFSSQERTWLRVAAFCALLVALPMLWQSSLGLPRPTELDLADPSGTVVSYVVDEPKAILVWLVPDGSNLPRAYSLAFETSRALQLQKAFADARHQGSEVRMEPGVGRNKAGGHGESDRAPGQVRTDASDGRDQAADGPDFYPAPQRANPLKADTVAGE